MTVNDLEILPKIEDDEVWEIKFLNFKSLESGA